MSRSGRWTGSSALVRGGKGGAAPWARRVVFGGVAVLISGCGQTPAPQPPRRSEGEVVVELEPGGRVEATCVPTGIERCFDARDDNCNGLIDEGCGMAAGLVQFVIAWKDPTADVDLLVTGPDGELVEVGRITTVGLVKERDCPGRRQDCAGQNVENVLLDGEVVARGRYEVRVRLESLGRTAPPLKVTFGARLGPKVYAAELALDGPEAERRLVFEL